MVMPYDPSQAAAPQEQPQSRFKLSSDPGFLQALSGFASGNTVGEQFASVNNILAGNAEKQKAEEVKNQTLGLLQSSPDLAAAVKAGAMTPSEAVSALMKQQAEAKKAAQPKWELQNIDGKLVRVDVSSGKLDELGDYSTAKKPNLINVGNGLLYDADSKQYIKPPADVQGAQTDYGLNPIWFKDQDGKYKLGVPGKDGSFKILPTPGDMEPLPGVSNVDLGTATGIRDNKSGDLRTTYQKDVSGQKEQETIGKEVGAIKTALPSARVTAKMVSDDIQAIIDDPALPNALGSIDSNLPTFREDTARVESRLDKLVGQSFLQAREMLRGGGQITDYEGQRAEKAMARLNRVQSPEDFKAALKEFNEAVQEGVKKLEAVAAGDLKYGGDQPAPDNNVENLVEKYRTK